MSLPIDHTLKSLKDIEAIALTGIDMFQHPKTGMELTTQILSLIASSGAVINNLVAAWPEFQNIDKDEAAQLGGALHDLIKAIVDKTKGQPVQIHPLLVPPASIPQKAPTPAYSVTKQFAKLHRIELLSGL